jgi:SAM-dependent methyltransferase
MQVVTCHVCGASAAKSVAGLEALRGVTSDCRLWPAGAHLAVCDVCGCAQKVLNAAWHADTQRIYGDYTIYYQSGGVEQAVFDPASGAASPRSARLLEHIVQSGALPAAGRLLDVGCGNGALLRSASEQLPGWRLAGTELDDKYRAVVESIPHVEALYVGAPSTAPGTFDAITMLHVLEHLPSPAIFMRKLHDKLAPNGLLVVHLPEFVQNPFDLLIADHCTHFSVGTLSAFLSRVGFEVLGAYNDWVPKELTVLARPSVGLAPQPSADPAANARRFAGAGVSWLADVLRLAQQTAEHPPFGLFGTSIAATWLGGELGERVLFFVDEDPARIGRQHLGKPIYDPGSMPANSSLLVALPGPTGEAVAQRVRAARPDVTTNTLPSLP